MNNKFIIIILLMLLLLSNTILLSSCDIYKSKESIEFLNTIKKLDEDFADKYTLANTTVRIALAPVISEMQDIRRDVKYLNVPKKAVKLSELKDLEIEYMDIIITGFMQFQSENDTEAVITLSTADLGKKTD